MSYGWSSLAFLLAISENKGTLYSIDMPYPKKKNEESVGLLVPNELKGNSFGYLTGLVYQRHLNSQKVNLILCITIVIRAIKEENGLTQFNGIL